MNLNTANDELGLPGKVGRLASLAVADLRRLADDPNADPLVAAQVAGVWCARLRRLAGSSSGLTSPRLLDALLTRAGNTPVTHTCTRCNQQVHRLVVPYTDNGDGFSSQFANPHGFAWCPRLPGDEPGRLYPHQVVYTTPPTYGSLCVVRRANGDLFAGRFVGWRPNGDAVVRTGTDAATGPVVDDARCCEGCEELFVPDPFGDPEVCTECQDGDAS